MKIKKGDLVEYSIQWSWSNIKESFIIRVDKVDYDNKEFDGIVIFSTNHEGWEPGYHSSKWNWNIEKLESGNWEFKIVSSDEN
jgi:hypothetical protein